MKRKDHGTKHAATPQGKAMAMQAKPDGKPLPMTAKGSPMMPAAHSKVDTHKGGAHPGGNLGQWLHPAKKKGKKG